MSMCANCPKTRGGERSLADGVNEAYGHQCFPTDGVKGLKYKQPILTNPADLRHKTCVSTGRRHLL